MDTFKESKLLFKESFQKVLAKNSSYEIDEAALPAYAHTNPLIDWLFWERLRVSFNYAGKHKPTGKVLDFGCGSGVLSYILSRSNFKVTAVDLDLGPLKLVRQFVDFPEGIDFMEADILKSELDADAYDVIFALDVLEHIENIDDYIRVFQRLLKPDGIVIVSGPTENYLYKIGRMIAGNKFTGHYHVTNIGRIKNDFKKSMEVKTIRRLQMPFVLFEVFVAGKRI